MNYFENNVTVLTSEEYLTPKKADVYLNPLLSVNRELVYEVLKVLVNASVDPIDCLDAFSGTGLCALQWKKNLSRSVNVTALDMNEDSIERIKLNCASNQIESRYKSISEINEEYEKDRDIIYLYKANANVVMHLKGFDFIHMDPFGSTAPYLDSAFKNIRNNGILVLTSTDIASLLTRNPSTVLRNYNAKVIKTEYVKELAVRTILAEAARSAAKCNKGIKVMLSVTDKNFIFVALKIKRGSNCANDSLLNVSELLHCRICQERAWYPSDKLAPIIDPYESLLSCRCHKENPGKTGVKIGPFWNGDVYDKEIVQQIINSDTFETRSKPFQSLMNLIKDEIEAFSSCRMPSFYYFIKNMNVGTQWPKFGKIISYVRSQGFSASRTHFDATAIRTDSNLGQLRDIIYRMMNV